MNGQDPLKQTLLDLHAILGSAVPLILGGGYGLFLRQDDLTRTGARTLFPVNDLPENRTTQDIDLILKAEVVVSADGMKSVRSAINTLGYTPIAGSEHYQFRKAVKPAGEIKIALLVGPLGDLFDAKTVMRDDRRVRPKAFKDLHAHPLEEAVGVEEHLCAITLSGQRGDGTEHNATVYVAQPFTYLLMKIFAFRDRVNDPGKDFARHHAIDIYRIVGLITQDEDQTLKEMATKHRKHPKVLEARAIIAEHFSSQNMLGILRMREHQLAAGQLRLDQFITELSAIFPSLP